MWRDVCLANRDALLAALEGYLEELELLRGMIEASDGQGLEERFAAARAARAKWLMLKGSFLCVLASFAVKELDLKK